jgi:hypothetical protein
VREAAQRDKGLRFTTLLHHVNEKLLPDSFCQLKKQAAPGVDRVTWGEYEEGVEARITEGRINSLRASGVGFGLPNYLSAGLPGGGDGSNRNTSV